MLARHYRDRAAEARRQAAKVEGVLRNSYLAIADQWELLATDIEAAMTD